MTPLLNGILMRKQHYVATQYKKTKANKQEDFDRKALGLFFSPVKASCPMCDFTFVCGVQFFFITPIVSKAVAETANS